jgi:hypothetical protein
MRVDDYARSAKTTRTFALVMKVLVHSILLNAVRVLIAALILTVSN